MEGAGGVGGWGVGGGGFTRVSRVRLSMVLLWGRCLIGLSPKTPAAISMAADVNSGCAQSA